MPPISLPRFRFGTLALVLAATLIAACDNPLALPPPQFANRVDTVTIYALRGTDITLPSAFDVATRAVARTDRGQPFDFAYDIDAAGQPLLFPAGALGLVTEPGIYVSPLAFDSVVAPPTEPQDFVVDATVPLTAGLVFVARSRNASAQCSLLGALPRYGKFRVLAIDPAQRSVTLQALVNVNCGYRALTPGFPTS